MTSLLRWSLVGALLFGLACGGEEEASEPEDTVENAEAEAEEEEPAEEPESSAGMDGETCWSSPYSARGRLPPLADGVLFAPPPKNPMIDLVPWGGGDEMPRCVCVSASVSW